MPPPSNKCRYCQGTDGKIKEGAHASCKHADLRAKQKARGGKLVYLVCKDCGAGGELNRVGRCEPCQFTFKAARKREALNRWKRAARAKKSEEIMETRLCACGCGRTVKSPRSHYATMQCAASVHNAKRPKREKKPAIPKDWTKPAVKPKVESGPVTDAVVPDGVGIKVLPSLLPATLRDIFGVHGPARLATDDWQ